VDKIKKLSFIIRLACSCLIFLLLNLSIFPSERINLKNKYSQFFTQAEKFRLKGEFEKSAESLEKSLDIAIQMADERKQCEALSHLGLLYWNLGKMSESLRCYEDSSKLALKLNLDDDLIKCQKALNIHRLYNEGKGFRYDGQYEKSIESFKKAIYLSVELGSQEHRLKCLRQMSLVYRNQNKLDEFKTSNEEALELAKDLNHETEQARCLINLGNYGTLLNNYSEALNYYEQALEIPKITRWLELVCLTNIGIIYKQLGEYEKALENFEKVLAIDRELSNDAEITMDLNNIGEVFRMKGLLSNNIDDFLEAKNHFEASLELIEDILKRPEKNVDKRTKFIALGTQVEVLNNMGTVFNDIGNLTQKKEYYYDALKNFKSSYTKADEIKDFEVKGMALTNMAIVNRNLENYEESTKLFEQSIDFVLQIGGEQILWEAYLEFAKVYEQQKNYDEAVEHYKASIDTTEKIRSRIVLEELKAKFLGTDKRIEAYHRLINLLVKLYHDEEKFEYAFEAFDYLERAKARAFLDSLELSRVDISEDIDAELLNREKELMKNITSIYSKLLAAELTPENRNNLHEELKNYENELDSLKREIRKKSPAYANLKYPEIITLDETQKTLLDTKTAIFAYSVGQEDSYAFVITKNDLKIFHLPGRKNIQDQVKDYLRIITDKDNQNFTLGHELFNHLVLPGLEKNIKNIIFVPDDILHFLPFEALITNNGSKNWLIKDYQIAYAPSISSLREIIERKKSNKQKSRLNLLAFGDPSFELLESEENGGDIFQEFFSSKSFDFYRLEFSGIEIDRISSLFKKKNIFRRKEASEDQLKNHNLEDYKIIHFATHSIIDERTPDRSSIVFTMDEDPAEDGFFQMREVYNTKLNSDLVTLSSCQTGLGEFIHGEGIEGINRAFFYAGASSVLMSLWAVNDQASCQLMERFYVHLRSSESIMNALRKAKLELIESDPLSHPYYWAGFIASGKADEIIFPRSSSKWIFLGALLVFVFGAIIILRKRLRKTA
jgi:CHAT domain-containing protein/Tfp pilus assembly protein PilF